MVVKLLKCLICVTILIGGDYMQEQNIQNHLTNYNNASVVIDGCGFDIDENKLNQLLADILEDSRNMPALGVSLHNETLKALNNGVWLKFKYTKTYYIDELPFDELLINVEPLAHGFNIIRGNNGIYEGRCYYIDLIDSTTEVLHNYLTYKK